jgi:hypothetical protein
LKNFRSLHGDETARHHAIEYRQESVDLFLRVDDFNHDRQILREAQDLRCMNAARMAESDMTAQDGCATEVHLPRLQDNRLVKRKALKSVVFSEKDAEQDGLPRNLHDPSPHFLNYNWPADLIPLHP